MHAAIPSTVFRYRDHLQVMPWLSLLGYGLLIVFYGTLFGLLLPRAWQQPFERMVLAAPLILVVAKDLACFPLCLARCRSARAHGASLPHRVLAILPPELMAWVRLERAMWSGCFSWALRRPHPVRPIGAKLGYLERGSYGTVVCCALLALFVEMPLDVMIVSLMAKKPAQTQVLHLVFGALALYGFVWVLGDRWHVLSRRHHVLTGTHLELDTGARGFGSIPLAVIASCERLNESRAAWCQRHGILVHATRKLSPVDGPNLVLRLQPGCDVRLTLLQQARGGDGPIFLYLDRPELLCAELTILAAPRG